MQVRVREGGRNQEAILATLTELTNSIYEDITIVCVGTDGIDGNSGNCELEDLLLR